MPNVPGNDFRRPDMQLVHESAQFPLLLSRLRRRISNLSDACAFQRTLLRVGTSRPPCTSEDVSRVHFGGRGLFCPGRRACSVSPLWSPQGKRKESLGAWPESTAKLSKPLRDAITGAARALLAAPACSALISGSGLHLQEVLEEEPAAARRTRRSAFLPPLFSI